MKRHKENQKLKTKKLKTAAARDAEAFRLREFELQIEKEKMDKNIFLRRHLKDAKLAIKQKDVDCHETAVSKMKLFDNVLRNSVTRISNNPVEINSLFKSVT